MSNGDVLELQIMFRELLVIKLSDMIYSNHGTKIDLLIENLRCYHVRKHLFGTQTIEIMEITCLNEKLITFFYPEKKPT